MMAWAERRFIQDGDHLYFATYLLGFYTGYRASRLGMITYDHIFNGIIKLNPAKAGKKRIREVPVHDRLSAGVYQIKTRLGIKDHNLPILAPKGRFEPVTTKWTGILVARGVKALGIETQVPCNHTMRKTFAMRLYEMQGKTEEALLMVSVMLGHKDTIQTRTYLGLSLNSNKVLDLYRRM